MARAALHELPEIPRFVVAPTALSVGIGVVLRVLDKVPWSGTQALVYFPLADDSFYVRLRDLEPLAPA